MKLKHSHTQNLKSFEIVIMPQPLTYATTENSVE